jgi:hypothetical protein
MAATKVLTAMESGLTLTAGAGDDTGAVVTIDTSYGSDIGIKITNGATGPTVAAQVQVQTSQDNSEWYDFGGALVAQLGNAVVTSWPVEIPMGWEYVRTIQGSNTVQDVTCDIDLSQVSEVA